MFVRREKTIEEGHSRIQSHKMVPAREFVLLLGGNIVCFSAGFGSILSIPTRFKWI